MLKIARACDDISKEYKTKTLSLLARYEFYIIASIVDLIEVVELYSENEDIVLAMIERICVACLHFKKHFANTHFIGQKYKRVAVAEDDEHFT